MVDSFAEIRLALEERHEEYGAQGGDPFSALHPIEKGVADELGNYSLEKYCYQVLHVEPLLERAAQLLTRCRAVRSEHQSLEVQAVTALFEEDQYYALHAIEERAVEAGKDAQLRSAHEVLSAAARDAEASLERAEELVQEDWRKKLIEGKRLEIAGQRRAHAQAAE